MHKSVYNWPIYQYLVVFIDILIVGAKGFGLPPVSVPARTPNSFNLNLVTQKFKFKP